MFSLAATDSAWLNATISTIALHYDLKIGGRISKECLFHRGEALRIVNERLVKSPGEVSDATIGAISTLANIDVSTFRPTISEQNSADNLVIDDKWSSL